MFAYRVVSYRICAFDIANVRTQLHYIFILAVTDLKVAFGIIIAASEKSFELHPLPAEVLELFLNRTTPVYLTIMRNTCRCYEVAYLRVNVTLSTLEESQRAADYCDQYPT